MFLGSLGAGSMERAKSGVAADVDRRRRTEKAMRGTENEKRG